MRGFILIIILLVFNLQVGRAHPVHVSICNIEIEKDTMTVSLKLFKDDFQLAIEHNFGKHINLEDIGNISDYPFIEDYIQSVFKLIANKKDTLKLSYINNELNEEAIWLNYKCYISELKKIQISNFVFLDIYHDQTNLVIINFNGKQNGYRFTSKNTDQQIDLR